jgi:hypothetical protein
MNHAVFLAGLHRILRAYNQEPENFPHKTTEWYWENLREFSPDSWEKAIDPILNLPNQRVPSPAAMRRMCKDIEGRIVRQYDMPPEMLELKRIAIEDRIRKLESRPPEKTTQRMLDTIINLKQRLIEEFPAGF